MNRHHFLPRCAALTLLACLSAACGSSALTTPEAGTSSALLRQIEAQAADLACLSDQQCHTLAVGAKACGGAERYLPWSSQHQDGSVLQALAARHAALRRREDAQSGMLSNCLVVPDPGASCVAQRCVLRQPGRGARPADVE